MNKFVAVGVLVLTTLTPALVAGQEVPLKYRPAVAGGLRWLAAQQAADGSWAADHGQHRVLVTALAGQAFGLEGSTTREGPYSDQVNRATAFLLGQSQRAGPHTGLIGRPDVPQDNGRCLRGHGWALLFLSWIYGEESNAKRRAEIKGVLMSALKFLFDTQSARGGWSESLPAGKDQDDPAVTAALLQGLREARNAGLPVPKMMMTRAADYLKDLTGPNGGVQQGGGEQPALTAAAIAAVGPMTSYKDDTVKKWLKYARTHLAAALHQDDKASEPPHLEFAHLSYACWANDLGDNGWDRLFKPKAADRLTWGEFRAGVFDRLVRRQQPEGFWWGRSGPVFATAVCLNVLQRDNANFVQLSR